MAGLKPRQQLIWVKNILVIGRQDYNWKHEPILYGWKEGAAHFFSSERTQTTVIEDNPADDVDNLKKAELLERYRALRKELEESASTIIHENKPTANIAHLTMKPVPILAKLIVNSSRKNDIVIDEFGGSGQTLIACEQTNRRCYIAEISERYANVIIDRWEKFTGQKAVRIDG